MKKKKMIKLRLIILMVLCAGLLLGAWIVRGHLIHEPFRTNVRQAFQAPCREYIFGTDNLGRCVACRILYGAATSLYAAVLAVLAVFIIGTAVGVTAAYAGGIVDRILMKITLVFQAFPNFILAVAVAGMLGTGLKNSVLALGAVYWITYAKLSRSLVLSIRDSEYIRAAKICGAGPTAIIFKYILPNMVSPLIVTAALDVSSFILSMAGLSFLGLGPSRPTAEWGATMSEAKTFIQQAPWCIVFPGLALHGPVWRTNLGYYLDKHDKWSRYIPEENGVMIVYASMYGNTESAAQALAAQLCEKGVTNVRVYDVSKTHVSYLVAEAFKYSHIVLASVTYNLNIYPVMEDFLHHLKVLNLSKRVFGIIENGSWAIKSGSLMEQYIDENLKDCKILNARMTINSSANRSNASELDALSDAIVKSVAIEEKAFEQRVIDDAAFAEEEARKAAFKKLSAKERMALMREKHRQEKGE